MWSNLIHNRQHQMKGTVTPQFDATIALVTVPDSVRVCGLQKSVKKGTRWRWKLVLKGENTFLRCCFTRQRGGS